MPTGESITLKMYWPCWQEKPRPMQRMNQVNKEVYSRYKDQSWEDVDTLVDTSLKRMGEAIAIVKRRRPAA